MIDSGLYAGAIEYHSYDNYTNLYSLGRIDFYGIISYPRSIFDGVLIYDGGGYLSNNYEHYLPLYNERIGIRTAFQMDIYGSEENQDNYTLLVVIHKKAPIINTNVVAHISVTESHIPEPSWPLNELDYVFRKFLPDVHGTPIDVENDSIWVIEYPLTLEGSWIAENCEITVFLQDTMTSEILQADKIMINQLLPFTLEGGFTMSTDTLYMGGSVEFADTSSGSPAYWQWNFPGGEPEISYDKNPEISYNSEGIYDVTMIVSDGVHTDTMYKPNLITVLENVGLSEKNANIIKIMPNPNNGHLSILLNVDPESELTLKLYNNTGNLVFHETVFNSGPQYRRKFDFSYLHDGIYLISIWNNRKHYHSKVLIQH